MTAVAVEGKKRYMLRADLPRMCADGSPDGLRMLGPHDPYPDLRDREIVLPSKALQRRVWRTVANPGVVLADGRVAGVWKTENRF